MALGTSACSSLLLDGRRATFGGEDLYPDIFHKAAALMESLIKNHPFIDGNKRTAITSTGIFFK